ncbi:MAG: T9SS type A sorting domain-containing protein [Ignavibacteriaceae bacterium]
MLIKIIYKLQLFAFLFQLQLFCQWEKVEAVRSSLIYSAIFDGNDIFVGGDSLYRSEDGGISWEVFLPKGQAIDITALYKFEDKIFAGTYGSGVYVSTNNGSTWQSFNIGLNGFALYARKFVSSGDTIFYGSDGGGIYYLIDNTNNWQSYNQNLPSNYAWTINDIAVTNNNLLVSAGASGYYYQREKGSTGWIEKRIQTPRGSFTTPNTIFVANDIVFSGHREGIYRSFDEGNSFDSVGIPTISMDVVSFAKFENRIFAGYTRSNVNDFFIWYTDDTGESWSFMDHQFYYLMQLYVYNGKLWVATNDGLWYNQLSPSSVESPNDLKTFVLEQNYPNPFNPVTKIEYSVPQLSQVQLKVFDVLGNEIATLVNDEKDSGIYEVNFNASELSSGIYFYKLRAGSFADAKKMLLLK